MFGMKMAQITIVVLYNNSNPVVNRTIEAVQTDEYALDLVYETIKLIDGYHGLYGAKHVAEGVAYFVENSPSKNLILETFPSLKEIIGSLHKRLYRQTSTTLPKFNELSKLATTLKCIAE
ncbi:hypothetical protein V3C99_012428 [Haemonchus contortus]